MIADSIHIIGEAGTNHGAKLTTAKQLVDAAVSARVDSVKFQIIYPEGLYIPKLRKDGRFEDNPVLSQRAAGMLSDDDYRELASYCKQQEIPISASIFDIRGLDLLGEFLPPYFKIASCDLNNTTLLKEVARRGKKMIVSTGMSSLGEVEKAVNAITSTGHTDLILMHCVSIYPCPLQQMNLNFVRVLQTAFGFPIGLSDHTESSLAAAIAVGMGVSWLEKHYTLDRGADGFDHHYAMEPHMLTAYVQDVRNAWTACRPTPTKLTDDEQNVALRARRGIYASRDIGPDEVIREDDLLVVRPNGPIAADRFDLVVGLTVRKPIMKYEAITYGSMDL